MNTQAISVGFGANQRTVLSRYRTKVISVTFYLPVTNRRNLTVKIFGFRALQI